MPLAEPIAIERIVVKKPSIFTVCILNDDLTPVQFVTVVLMDVFRISEETSFGLTMDIHTKGEANIGEYTREVAEMKAQKIVDHARDAGFPLTAFPKELS
jgi:ATP-dependent Clp protease adaptor protein ClpS